MCDDNDEGDEGSGDQSGQGTPPTLSPPANAQRNPTTAHRSAPLPEEPAEPTGDFQHPHLRELDNGYKVVWDGERWLLFDDEGFFIGYYQSAEDARDEAYRRKPLGRFGM